MISILQPGYRNGGRGNVLQLSGPLNQRLSCCGQLLTILNLTENPIWHNADNTLSSVPFSIAQYSRIYPKSQYFA